jgi:hypothetical protein
MPPPKPRPDARVTMAFLALLDHGMLPAFAARLLKLTPQDARAICERHPLRPAYAQRRCL